MEECRKVVLGKRSTHLVVFKKIIICKILGTCLKTTCRGLFFACYFTKEIFTTVAFLVLSPSLKETWDFFWWKSKICFLLSETWKIFSSYSNDRSSGRDISKTVQYILLLHWNNSKWKWLKTTISVTSTSGIE